MAGPVSVPPLRGGMTEGAHRATRRLGWILVGVFVILLVVAGLNLYLTLTRTVAACNFYKDLSGLPVTVINTTHRPSELGVAIVAHSREAFHGAGCPGKLPPPSPSFAHWAPYFGFSSK